MKRIRILSLFLAVVMLLTSCGTDLSATTMHLIKTTGTVAVVAPNGTQVQPTANMGLYSGSRVSTQTSSYGWIDLDETKLVKMDERSGIEVVKSGKKLEILVESGQIFFNVTKPLENDETMNIRTSNMVVGIRGTCGWVTVDGANDMSVSLLSGKVTCAVLDKMGKEIATEAITAGETASMTYDGASSTITVREVKSIPPFVRTEVGSSSDSAEVASTIAKIEGESSYAGGSDTLNAPVEGEALDSETLERNRAFMNVLNGVGTVYYADLLDLNADGVDDMITYMPTEVNGVDTCVARGYIWDGEHAIATYYQKAWFLDLGGVWPCALWREKSTGIVYVSYMLDQDIVAIFMQCYDPAKDTVGYDSDFNFQGSTMSQQQAINQLAADVSERFDLVKDLTDYGQIINADQVTEFLDKLDASIDAASAGSDVSVSGGEFELPSGDLFGLTPYTGAGMHIDFNLYGDGRFEESYYFYQDSGKCTGRFENLTKLNDYTYRMTIAETDSSDWKIGDAFYLYCPGTPINEIPESYLPVLEAQRDMYTSYDIMGNGVIHTYVLIGPNDAGYTGLW